jgi:hypothetical protein
MVYLIRSADASQVRLVASVVDTAADALRAVRDGDAAAVAAQVNYIKQVTFVLSSVFFSSPGPNLVF